MQLKPLSSEKFLDALLKGIAEMPAEDKTPKKFGLSNWLASSKEAVARLGSAPSDAATARFLALEIKSARQKTSGFSVDIFVNLLNRGTAATLGPIVHAVLQAFRDADAARQAGVINHHKLIGCSNDLVLLQRKLGRKKTSISKAIGNEMVEAVVLAWTNLSAIGSIILRSPGPISPDT